MCSSYYVYNCMCRWEVEQDFRFLKLERAIEPPRLCFWDNRMKIMTIVTLVYDFLLQMIHNWGLLLNSFSGGGVIELMSDIDSRQYRSIDLDLLFLIVYFPSFLPSPQNSE